MGTPSLPGLLLIIARPSFAVDANKSYYVRTKGFPLNDEISVNLTFNGPPHAVPTVPDGRGDPDRRPLQHRRTAGARSDVRSALRRRPDRLLHHRAQALRERRPGLAVRALHRTLEHGRRPDRLHADQRDPAAVPRHGAPRDPDLEPAFARIGYSHAIEVRDPPTDPALRSGRRPLQHRPLDHVGLPVVLGYSPHESDPDTGQIIRAEVVIDGESMRSIRLGYTNRVEPVQRARHAAYAYAPGPPLGAVDDLRLRGARDDGLGCDVASESADQAAVGMSELLVNPQVTKAAARTLRPGLAVRDGPARGRPHAGATAQFRGLDGLLVRAAPRPGVHRRARDHRVGDGLQPGQRRGAQRAASAPTSRPSWASTISGRSSTATQVECTRSLRGGLPMLQRIAAHSTDPGHAYGTDEDVIAPYDRIRGSRDSTCRAIRWRSTASSTRSTTTLQRT